MSRLARLIVPGYPHHVTQRGNRRAPVFFEDGDYALYRDLLAERCRKASVACWAYCLMPNHVTSILVPSTADGLARAIGETHRQYTGFVNARARWTGHLFQGRFSSVVLDEEHLMLAARYRGAQSGAGPAGAAPAGLGMVEPARASRWARRQSRDRRAAARTSRQHAPRSSTPSRRRSRWRACAPPKRPDVRSARMTSSRGSKISCSAACGDRSRDQRLKRRKAQVIFSPDWTAGRRNRVICKLSP